ncbi:hypothetical protein HDU76_008442 [Blyttiomyces sp. JEL0837]|nr:hypothetical protein HDU76_008442 [Blyttiomyces sp. JEL0837]
MSSATQAKGIAILSVFKAGFLFSGRGGAGLVVAKLDDGSWSAPSAIGTAGFGAGGQIGIELTDFVIILNTKDAVKAFSHGGNVTLGGNLSVAAGPIGRNAEAAGTVGNFAAIYSYSKTRGLFVGVSIEGSVIVERKETNASFYRRKVSAKEILSGGVPPPSAAEELYRSRPTTAGSSQWPDNRASDNKFPRPEVGGGFPRPMPTSASTTSTASHSASHFPRAAPPPPPSTRQADKAVALYDFNGERDGDLSFRKGDQITILQKNANDWWLGRINGVEGVFPANYVQTFQ